MSSPWSPEGQAWPVRKGGNRPWGPRAEGEMVRLLFLGPASTAVTWAPCPTRLSQHLGPVPGVCPKRPHLPGFPVLTQPLHGST